MIVNLIIINSIIQNITTVYPTGEGIQGVLFIFIMLYWRSISVARRERDAGITDTSLASKWRWILFLNASNPFRKKTIIYQICLIIMMIMTLLITFLLPNTRIAILFQGAYLLGMVLLMFVLDMRLRK